MLQLDEKNVQISWILKRFGATVVPTKSDSDVIFYLQLLS